MARVTIEDALKKINNRFTISIMAMKRAKQLRKGSKPLIGEEDNREVGRAGREIAAGKVTIKEKD